MFVALVAAENARAVRDASARMYRATAHCPLACVVLSCRQPLTSLEPVTALCATHAAHHGDDKQLRRLPPNSIRSTGATRPTSLRSIAAATSRRRASGDTDSLRPDGAGAAADATWEERAGAAGAAMGQTDAHGGRVHVHACAWLTRDPPTTATGHGAGWHCLLATTVNRTRMGGDRDVLRQIPAATIHSNNETFAPVHLQVLSVGCTRWFVCGDYHALRMRT